MSNGVHDPSLSVDALGQWRPPADRRDPIAVLQEQEANRLPWLVPVRHGRMAPLSGTSNGWWPVPCW